MVDGARVAALKRDGLSWSQVCRTLDVSKGSAQRSVARLGARPRFVEGTRRVTDERSLVL